MTRCAKWLAAALVLAVVPATALADVSADAGHASSSTATRDDDAAKDINSNGNDESPAAATTTQNVDTLQTTDFESWEFYEDEQTGAMQWRRVDASGEHEQPPRTASASPDPQTQAELDELFANARGGVTIKVAADSRLGETLQQLVENAAARTGSWLELIDNQRTLHEHDDASTHTAATIADDSDDADDSDAYNGPTREPPELTDEFLALEKRIDTDGFTPAIVAELETLATTHHDVYAHEALAYMTLFEPFGAHAARSIADAFASLRVAADAGVAPARSALALLNRIDVGVARNASMPARARHAAADAALEQLAVRDDLAASLAVGYRHLRTMLSESESESSLAAARVNAACSRAVAQYHKVAESNVHALADRGGERQPPTVERLSEQWRPTSTLFGGDDDAAAGLGDAAQRFEYYRTLAADAGDPQFAEAAEHVAQTYYYGDAAAGVAADPARAAAYFAAAADAGDAHAQANFGMLLAHGSDGVPQNNASAVRYLRAAAAQGDAFAHFGLALLYQTGAGDVVVQNLTRAALLFERAAALGYDDAHTHLGAAYLHGHGVTRNVTRAFEHFAYAATATESALARFNLAVVQFRGLGTPPTCHDAVHNFRAVALHADALADLPFSVAKGAECFAAGDVARAFVHYRLVAEFGDEDALTNAAFLLETHGHAIYGTAAAVAAVSQTDSVDKPATTMPWMEPTNAPLADAFALYAQAARLNDTESLRKTALCYYDDWGGVCARNRTRALAQYARAAALGDAEAAYTCGFMHALGDGVGRDLAAAQRYYAQCSSDTFPFNVPCALALRVLEVALAVRSLGQRLQLVLGLS